jgi:hypothetical protein
MMEKREEGWKREVMGRTLLSLSSGLDLDTLMKVTDMSMPMAVICVSPYLMPSRYSTDRL